MMSKAVRTNSLPKTIRKRTSKVSAKPRPTLVPSYLPRVDADLDGLFDAPAELDRRLRWWISTHVSPASKPHPNHSGGMKHTFSSACNCYVTADIFKGAMLASGFLPVNPREPYGWRWKVKIRNSGERCPGSEKFITCWPADRKAANG